MLSGRSLDFGVRNSKSPQYRGVRKTVPLNNQRLEGKGTSKVLYQEIDVKINIPDWKSFEVCS